MATKPYTVTIGGIDHRLLLSSDDAARYGDRAKPVSEPVTKARKPANKAAEPEHDRAARRSRRGRNSEARGE